MDRESMAAGVMETGWYGCFGSYKRKEPCYEAMVLARGYSSIDVQVSNETRTTLALKLTCTSDTNVT
jgi:hypothetical protein